MSRTISSALFIYLLFTACLCFAELGNIQPVSVQDHFSHPMGSRFWTENWRYHAILDTGEFLSLSFVLSKLGIVSGAAGIQLTL